VKGNQVEIDVGEAEIDIYIFIVWDQRILPLLPYGYGEKFPAVLTW